MEKDISFLDALNFFWDIFSFFVGFIWELITIIWNAGWGGKLAIIIIILYGFFKFYLMRYDDN